jgi:hypothetical protein
MNSVILSAKSDIPALPNEVTCVCVHGCVDPLVWPLLAAAIVAASGGPSLAIDTTLAPQRVERAVADGRAMALQHLGFTIAPYLLFGLDDATRLQDGQTIEAIEVGTAYERLRYRGYLSGFERAPLTATAIRALYEEARTRLDLIVYAHSRNEVDRDFLDGFGGGTLECAGRSSLQAGLTHDAPVRDVYLSGATPTWRWRGELTYRFALTDAVLRCDPATFTFTDDLSVRHRYAVTLASYG